MGLSSRRTAAALLLLSAAAGVAGCETGAVRAPNPTRALEERRAIEIIQRAVGAEGQRPAAARSVSLTAGKQLTIDVSVDGRAYGIAYITADDARELGDAIPPRNGKDERLRLVRAGGEGAVRVVLLYQDNYLYDDLAGDAHEQTAISCEASLTRDVRDFLTHARTKGFE